MAGRLNLNKVNRIIRYASVVGFGFCVTWTPTVFAQKKNAEKPPAIGSKSPKEVVAIYADAASFQNNSAFDLAIVEWKKLIEKFPQDPLIPKAQHYLGVSYLQLANPEFEKAIQSFQAALKDPALDVREESLINLGWALFSVGRSAQDKVRTESLSKARQVFKQYSADFADGVYGDRALFYSAECEYLLGHGEDAAKLYRQFINAKPFAKSPFRPDALYAMGVNYEELKQSKLAREAYDEFMANFSEHRLAGEVSLRKAEFLIADNKPAEAVELLRPLVDNKAVSMQDYVLSRYGYALAKSGKFDESSKIYKRLTDQYPNSQFASGAQLAAGQTLMRDKRYDEAADFFKRLLANKNEQAAEAAHWLCQIAILQGKSSQAVPIAREALAWSESTPWLVALKMDLAEGLSEAVQTKPEARDLFAKIATDHAKDPLATRALYNAAFTSLQLGQPEQAKSLADNFLVSFANDALAGEAAYISAESALQLGKHEEAAIGFEKLIASQPNSPLKNVWNLRLATALYFAGQYDKVISNMTGVAETLKEPKAIAEAQYLLGASLIEKSKFDEAIVQLEKSIKTAPDWAQADEVHIMLSECYTEAKKPEKSLEVLENLIKNYPDSSYRFQALYRIGQNAAAKSEFDKAISNYDIIIQTCPQKPLVEFASYAKSWVLMQQQKYPEAIELLKPIAEQDRKDSIGLEAKLALAICHRQSGQVEQSIPEFTKLLELQPKENFLGNTLYEMSIAQTQLKNYEQAASLLTRIVSEVPAYGLMDRVLYELGWAFKHQNKTDQSTTAFRDLIEKFPTSNLVAEAAYHVGQGEYAQQKFQAATVSYRKAVDTSKDTELVEKSLYKLGWSLFKQNDFDQAKKYFVRQINDFPNGALKLDALFMLGECESKAGNYANAMGHFRDARKILEGLKDSSQISEQVKVLIYLNGAQAARELKQWSDCEEWLKVIIDKYNTTSYIPQAIYELAYCYQNQKKTDEAIRLYGEVAGKYRTEVAARARFMMGEVFFAERDFAKAIPEFQRVMFGFGGVQAPAEIKNWQARSAFEAGRCAELLIGDLTGDRREKAIKIAKDFFQYLLDEHSGHELVEQAKQRLDALAKL